MLVTILCHPQIAVTLVRGMEAFHLTTPWERESLSCPLLVFVRGGMLWHPARAEPVDGPGHQTTLQLLGLQFENSLR